MAKYKSRFQGQVIDAMLQAVIDGKAGIQGVKIDNAELIPDSENKVNIPTSELNIPEVVQETGQSISKVMSQNSISLLLSQKANLNDLSNVAYSGSYIDLSNKPNIPTKTSDLANDSNFVSNSDLSANFYSKTQTDNLLSSKANTNDLSTVATSGQYSDLSGLPSIPSKTSDLTNDNDFVSSSDLSTNFYNKTQTDALLDGKVDKITGKGLSTEDYTSSDKNKLANIEQEANKTIVVNQTGTSTTDVMSQNAVTVALGTKADVNNLSTVAISGSYNDLLDKPSIPSVIPSVVQTTGSSTTDVMSQNAVTTVLSSKADSSNLSSVATSGSYNDLSNKPTIPTIRTSYAVGSNNSAYSIDYINGLSCLSTSEKRLGTWIDGSTLYRKTIQFIITGVENTYYEYNTGISNASIMIIDPAYSFISGGGNLIMINSARGNGTALTEHWNWFRVNSGGLIAYAFGSAIANLGGASCVLTLNYTKRS